MCVLCRPSRKLAGVLLAMSGIAWYSYLQLTRYRLEIDCCITCAYASTKQRSSRHASALSQVQGLTRTHAAKAAELSP